MVLGKCALDLLVRHLPLVYLVLALVFERIYLSEQHLATGLLLLVDLVRAESLRDLPLDLLELRLALLHHFAGHFLVVVLKFADRFQLLNVGVHLLLVRFLEVLPELVQK